MEKKNSNEEILKQQQQTIEATRTAEKVAEADIQKDLDLTPPKDVADDLDEGELARYEGED